MSLHWLPVMYRIYFKIILLVYKYLNDLASQCLTDLLLLYTASGNLRSCDLGLLIVPKVKLKMCGVRLKLLETFKSYLKTYLFTLAFNSPQHVILVYSVECLLLGFVFLFIFILSIFLLIVFLLFFVKDFGQPRLCLNELYTYLID